jgi:hypothetical protein
MQRRPRYEVNPGAMPVCSFLASLMTMLMSMLLSLSRLLMPAIVLKAEEDSRGRRNHGQKDAASLRRTSRPVSASSAVVILVLLGNIRQLGGWVPISCMLEHVGFALNEIFALASMTALARPVALGTRMVAGWTGDVRRGGGGSVTIRHGELSVMPTRTQEAASDTKQARMLGFPRAIT